MYKRKTRDIYEVQGYYCGEWEEVTTETTRKAAIEQLHCYNENENAPHRIVKKRERIEEKKGN